MASPPPGPFGRLLKGYRVAAGLTQETLATQAGLAARSISDLERGRRHTPYRDTVTRLARVLQLSEVEAAELHMAAQRRGAPRAHADTEALAAPSVRASGADAPFVGRQSVGQGATLALARQPGERVEPSAGAPPPSAGQLRVVQFPRVATYTLPTPPTPLIGRESEVGALCALLRHSGVRLLTMTGTAGVGKTRLALAVAAELVDDFAAGVWLVRLSRLADPGLALSTIAQTLGVPEQSGRPLLATLCASLRDLQLLLVLDNFEHVLGAASAVGALLEATAGLRIVVTSRAPLRLRGEQRFPVSPLALPALAPTLSPERLAESAAVALFVARARAVQPDFVLTVDNGLAVAEICARLDGVPLAIELAAARITLLPPEALVARLASRLRLLSGGAPDLEAHQRTMEAAIAWSEDLLTPAERALFQHLAVFAGGATLEALEAVCAAADGEAPQEEELLDQLSALIDQSLAQQREEGSAPRFSMLHVIREYALKRLETSGESEPLRRAHAAYYLALAEQAAPSFFGPNEPVWAERLEPERDNLRAALRWALERQEAETLARLCLALDPFWNQRGYVTEWRGWLAHALSQSSSLAPRHHALLLGLAGLAAMYQSDWAEATERFEASLALFQLLDDRARIGDVLEGLGGCALLQDQLERAQQLLEEALALQEAHGDRLGVLEALLWLVKLWEACGDEAAEQRMVKEALALAQSLGDTRDVAECTARLGWLALRRGDHVTAEALLDEAVAAQQRLGDTNGSALSLRYLGLLALERGDAPAAQERLEQSLALFEALAQPHGIAATLVWVGSARFAAGDGQGAEEAYRASLRLGRTLPNRRRTAACLEGLAELALARRQPEQVARLLGGVRQTLGAHRRAPLPPRLAARREGVASAAREALGEEAWAAGYAAGQALTPDEAARP